MNKLLNQLSARGVCFLFGDIFSMGFYLLFGEAFTHFMLKALGTLVIGMLGGLAGLAGKDLYPILKEFVKKKLFNHKKRQNEKLSKKAK